MTCLCADDGPFDKLCYDEEANTSFDDDAFVHQSSINARTLQDQPTQEVPPPVKSTTKYYKNNKAKSSDDTQSVGSWLSRSSKKQEQQNNPSLHSKSNHSLKDIDDDGMETDDTSDAARQIKAKVFMISGCKDSQTSADVSNIQQFSLPDPNGKSGGACTSALLKGTYVYASKPTPFLLTVISGSINSS